MYIYIIVIFLVLDTRNYKLESNRPEVMHAGCMRVDWWLHMVFLFERDLV